jgi:uncharacterized protein (TIRG00374 family)
MTDASAPSRPPLVRSPVYVLRLVAGLVLLLGSMVLLLLFENGLLGVRADLESIQANWPEWLTTSSSVGLEILLLLTVLIVNGYLLVRRKFRRWITINLAAIMAVLLGAVMSNLVLVIATSDLLADAVEASGDAGLGNDGLSSVVAVLTVASVWIGARLRPWAIGLVAAMVALSLLPGAVSVTTIPFDIGVGLVAGGLAALILGTRDRTPTEAEVAATLRRSGIAVSEVLRASVDARGSVPWFASTTSGERLFVKTLNSDQRAGDLLFRVYRMIRLRSPGDRRPYSSLRRAVEHEAFLSLAADAREIRTPHLVTVAEVGSDGMLLAYRRLDGRSLDSVDPASISDELLRNVWQLVATLREAGIAHRDLRLANVFVADDDVPWLIDFGFAELAAEESLLARDNAELLASTAAVVGHERAVSAAIGVLGPEGVEEALPWIQPLALSSATRTQIGKSEQYERLRKTAADAAGVDEVEFERIERVKPGTLLMLASIGLALYALVPQIASATGFFDELTSAEWEWVAVAILFSAFTYVGASIGMLGAIPTRLTLGEVMMAQVASSFSNRVTPAKVGGMATNVRFMQKKNIPLSIAASAVGMNTVAGTIIHVTLLAITGTAVSRNVDIPLPDARIVTWVVVGVILVSGLVMLLPFGKRLITRHLLPALRAATSSVASIARTPSKLAALFVGSALVTLSYTAAMIVSLMAFGADVPVVTAAAVYLAGAAVSSAAPTPGGVGATEAALVAGFAAIGVESATALAAVLLFRLVTFWLPILPGWLALIHLQRTGRL